METTPKANCRTTAELYAGFDGENPDTANPTRQLVERAVKFFNERCNPADKPVGVDAVLVDAAVKQKVIDALREHKFWQELFAEQCERVIGKKSRRATLGELLEADIEKTRQRQESIRANPALAARKLTQTPLGVTQLFAELTGSASEQLQSGKKIWHATIDGSLAQAKAGKLRDRPGLVEQAFAELTGNAWEQLLAGREIWRATPGGSLAGKKADELLRRLEIAAREAEAESVNPFEL